MNPLFFIPLHRSLSLVLKSLQENIVGKFDILIVINHRIYDAYNIGMKYFLKSNHTHFCLIPDDLVIDSESFNLLLNNIDKYDVLSGVCNLTYSDNRPNICINTIPDLEDQTWQDIDKSWITFEELGNSINPLKVQFAGFPVTFIKRWVMEQMKVFKPNKYGVSFDAQFGKYLRKNNIDQYIIPKSRFIHLKDHPKYKDDLKSNTGIGIPDIMFISKED